MIMPVSAETTATGVDRRARILDAAGALASRGGYEAVLMRAVATDANVAIATVYRYFPSKVHLLIGLLARELDRTEDRLDRAILRGDTPHQRVMRMTNLLTKALQRDARLTEAMTRAVLFADVGAAAEVDAVQQRIDLVLARAMTTDDPTEGDLDVARVLRDVWLTNLAAWATRRGNADALARRLELAVHLLLGR